MGNTCASKATDDSDAAQTLNTSTTSSTSKKRRRGSKNHSNFKSVTGNGGDADTTDSESNGALSLSGGQDRQIILAELDPDAAKDDATTANNAELNGSSKVQFATESKTDFVELSPNQTPSASMNSIQAQSHSSANTSNPTMPPANPFRSRFHRGFEEASKAPSAGSRLKRKQRSAAGGQDSGNGEGGDVDEEVVDFEEFLPPLLDDENAMSDDNDASAEHADQ